MVKIINTSGKKKTAVARATLNEGSGRIRINKKPLEIYEPELARIEISNVLDIAGDIIDGIDIDINVRGGGFMGQAGAARTAMAKGLVEWTEDTALSEAFSEFDRNLLVSDHRQKEVKKYGGPGARAKRQKSYR